MEKTEGHLRGTGTRVVIFGSGTPQARNQGVVPRMIEVADEVVAP